MTVLATIVLLGVLIFVHELGHFVAAKLMDIRVERFSIGLGPVILSTRRGETEYALSAIPLGGYVKMGGMDDEVMERLEGGAAGGAEPRRPNPRDYDAKSVPARVFVISAGVIMNMLFAFFAFVAIAGFWGAPEVDSLRVGVINSGRLPAGTEALAAVPVGAEITRVGDRQMQYWSDIPRSLLEAPAGPLSVETASPAGLYQIEVPADPELRRRLASSLAYWLPAEIGGVNPGTPADDGDLEAGDRILAVAGVPVETWEDFVREIQARPEMETDLLLQRDGRQLTRRVTPEAGTRQDVVTGEEITVGQVGVIAPLDGVPTAYTHVGLGEAIGIGWRETIAVTGLIVGFLRDLVTGNVSPRSVGSIVAIGEMSGQAAQRGPADFLGFMGLFSINLAVLNLLPIPILDGGHLVFLLIEAVRGKALSIEQRMRWSQFGLLIVMGIMILALSNDIRRVLGF